MAGEADVIKLRVVDTATFIEAGKRANGDLYDYSQSVFVGWRKPILIGCNRCGKLINLKNAGSHYIKRCGCKACNHDRLSPCRVCGVEVSSKVYHKQNKKCKGCHDKYKRSVTDPWMLLAKREVRRNCQFDAWERKCRSVIGSLGKRKKPSELKSGLQFATWEEKAKNQIRRVIYDKDYTAWELKCRTAFKGLKKRKLKSHRSDQS